MYFYNCINTITPTSNHSHNTYIAVFEKVNIYYSYGQSKNKHNMIVVI